MKGGDSGALCAVGSTESSTARRTAGETGPGSSRSCTQVAEHGNRRPGKGSGGVKERDTKIDKLVEFPRKL